MIEGEEKRARTSRLILGNWKMNGTGSELKEVEETARGAGLFAGLEVGLCLPGTLLERAYRATRGSGLILAGQDCAQRGEGAWTGETSARMLKEAGATMCLAGHSERRELNGEDDAAVERKVREALCAGLEPVVCIGETREERDLGETREVLRRGMERLRGEAVWWAYEPRWAIGAGFTPPFEEVAEILGSLKEAKGLGVLYGGSANEGNAADLMRAGADGLLVGGASLTSARFLEVCERACDVVG